MIEKKVLRELEVAVGRNKVFADREYRLAYSYDALAVEYLPDAVVFPEHDEDIASTCASVGEHRLPLVARGAGVGYRAAPWRSRAASCWSLRA